MSLLPSGALIFHTRSQSLNSFRAILNPKLMGPYGLWQPLLLEIFTIKHFKNVSGKVRSGHRFYSDGLFLQIKNNSRPYLQNYAHTHRWGGVLDRPAKITAHRAMRGGG